MDIVSEPLELEQIEAAMGEPAEIADIEELPEAKPKVKAKAKPRARARPEPEPLPAPEVPVIAAPKAKTRKPPAPAAAPTYAPIPAVAPGISDVLGMLATALLDQRQQRNAQRSAMYQAFLD